MDQKIDERADVVDENQSFELRDLGEASKETKSGFSGGFWDGGLSRKHW